ncbi:hypothetical protein M8013_09010 [Enterobacteriaceae bacterium H4N4]|uniref:Uncharacterized protein n=1 Tax=Silvania confinis TaxID=2926470 RepID=A0A9J6QAT1_9ENTR|nr:hypothetical protein [Silvania confinis]MCU6668888.1 hypothetical protein [Silvania confinis]
MKKYGVYGTDYGGECQHVLQQMRGLDGDGKCEAAKSYLFFSHLSKGGGMNQDFQDIKNEFDQYEPDVGEGIALTRYESLSKRLAPWFFNQDVANKRRLLQKLDEGEKEIGTQNKYDWFEALNRYKPDGR